MGRNERRKLTVIIRVGSSPHRREQPHHVGGVVGGLLGGGVKHIPAGAAVEVESGGTGSDVVLLTLQCDHLQVQEVTWGGRGEGEERGGENI